MTTAIEVNMSIAGLRTAGGALRDEPYERLPALAGELLIAAMRLEEMHARIKQLEEFVRDVATNYDCDADGHRYNTGCRCCEAEGLLKPRGD